MNESYLIDSISSSLERCTKTGNTYNFRCNICGDSEKNSRKKRAYILNREGKWFFYCHNCNISYSLKTYLKKYFPEAYKQLLFDNLVSSDYRKPVEKEVKLRNTEEAIKEYYKDCKFISITSQESQVAKDAVRFCEKRRIFPEVWKKYLVCTSGKLKNRLIIPFYNSKGDIVYFQARKLYENMQGAKYISQIGDKHIYNIDFVNKIKPIIAVEGTIDSTFIENSVAIIGTHGNYNIDKTLESLNVFYLFDNDEAGKEASLKAIKKGKCVFSWKMFVNKNNLYYDKIKDINDLFIKLNKKDKFTYNELREYFVSNELLM